MEISSNYPFYRAIGAENLENHGSAQPESAKALSDEAAPEAPATDRVELAARMNA